MTFLPVPFDPTQITSKTNRSNPRPGDNSHALAAAARPPHIVSVTGSVAHTLKAEGADASEDGTGRGTPIIAHCLTAHSAKGGDPTTDNYAVQNTRVRRLTPRECERLQGFPDDYTLIPILKTKRNGVHKHWASDSARYKAVGNSMAVPCMRWLGERIEAVDALEAA
jgi:DNA (cytosine-5)-methyltransferase 1